MTGPIRVLLVDDDDAYRHLAATRLEQVDDRFTVATSEGASVALERLEADSYDCVVVDYVMPGMDGLAFLRTVREERPDLPVLVSTAHGSETFASEAIDAGVTDYVPKAATSDDFTVLARRIERAVETWRTRRRAREADRIADLVRTVQSELVSATTTAEIDAAVCDILADADPYRFAWIGDHDTASRTVTPRSAAGIDDGYLESIEISTDDSPTGKGPTGKAVTTLEMQVLQDIPSAPEYEPWQADALERGYRSSAAVPLERDGTLYGVLNIYAGRTNAFDDEERALLAELGDTIAHAYHRVTLQRQYEMQYRELFEEAPVMVATTRSEDGTPIIEECNRRFAATLGYDRHELSGRKLADVYSNESADMMLADGDYERAISGEFVVSERELVTNDGERLITLLQASPRRNQAGEVVGTHALFVDVTERRRAADVLEQANAMEAAIDGMAILDGAGEFVYVNDAFVDVHGYDTADQLRGNSWKRCFDDVERLEREVFPALADDDEWRGEAIGLRADGSTFVQELSLKQLDDGGAICVVRDVTENVQRERELEQFREAVDETAHAIYITDADGTIEYVNPAFEAITGYREPEVLGRTPRILQSGEYDEGFYERLWEKIQSGERFEAEMIDQSADGDRLVLHQTITPITDEDGTVRKFVAVAQDVTERNAYEQALEETQRELRQIIDLVPDLIFVKNRDGEFVLANETTAEVFGTAVEEIEGKRESAVIPDVDQAGQFHDDDLAVIESGEPMFIPEEELTTADGETWILQTTKLPYESSSIDTGAVLGYGRNVTELKTYERALETQRDNLEVLNKVVRHDIRNELQLVLVYADMLTEFVDDAGREFLEHVLTSADNAVDITETARDVTEVLLQPDPEFGPIHVQTVLRSEIDSLRSNYEHADVSVVGSIPEAVVLADDMLGSVFRNLLTNAIEHNDQSEPTVTIGAERTDDRVFVRIADDGPGISDDRKAAIFEEGEKSLESDGTGLGLYLVETLLERYGGDVRIEDNDPCGAVFVVELPCEQ